MSFTEGQTLFGRVPEKNVYFLLDTSGSMYHQLGFVKEHLVKVLSSRACTLNDSMFNVIEFKDDVDKWADKLVHCTPTTVNLAARWIMKLECGTTTNTMGALIEAFNDSAIEAVYMVTDGLPDQRPSVILDKLKLLRQGTPIHSIYLNGVSSDPTAHDFLRALAEQTRGSFHIVTLSHNGSVEKVIPVYNAKGRFVQHYDARGHVFSDTNMESQLYANVGRSLTSDKCLYNHRPLLGIDDFPYPPMHNAPILAGKYNAGSNSKILDYADAVIKARGLAESAGIRCCSTPVACSLMKGMKVLARHDHDGLYYLGEVIKQGPGETFIVKYDSSPAIRKPVVQETSIHNMIAYKDAVRAHVSLGDHVLAPWQQDGRYGPGTVLDGIDRRDTQSGENKVLVTFFNGETVELDPGIAVRIPKATFQHIVRDLQLPESQRRKHALPESNIPATFDSQIERTGHEKKVYSHRDHTPTLVSTRAWAEESRLSEDHKLRKKINDQLKENSYLLHALDLNDDFAQSRVLGKATTSDLRGYDSGVFSEDSSEASGDDSRTTYDETFRTDVGVGTHDKEYDLDLYSSFCLPPMPPVLSKSGGNIESKKRWRYWSNGVPTKQPRFRETLLQKPREPGEKITNTSRPGHQEYRTVAGVSFPAGTDRKFDTKPQSWHPYRQFGDPPKKNSSAVWKTKHLKHSEYQDASGVVFPSATDRKFTRSIDPNWRPETAIENAERSRSWEAGLGQSDVDKDAKYADKLERISANQGKYFKEIQDKVAVEEEKEVKKIEFRRNKMTQREENLAEAAEEKNALMTNRLKNKTERQAAIQREENERADNAKKWKHTRIEVRRDRLAKCTEMEETAERQKETRMAVRETRRRIRENDRREDFHEKLREEWRNEDKRVEFLQRKHEFTSEKESRRQQNAEERKEARLAAKQERLDKYRASVLP